MCKKTNEKVSHVLLCPDGGAVTNTSQKITGPVKKLLDAKNTYPLLRDYILDILTRWRRGTRIRPIDYDISIRPNQSVLGWNNFVLGRWSSAWHVIQARHFRSISSKQTSLWWATAVINQLFLTAWDIWQYCNNRLHGRAGPLALAQYSALDNRMEEEMIAGYAGMTQHTPYLN